MNIANSKMLLLIAAMCFCTYVGSATVSTNGIAKEVKKEIIIVNVDNDLSNQVAGLADYAFNLYKSGNKGSITITTYLKGEISDSPEVTDLLDRLSKLGVEKDDLVVKQEELVVPIAYFTVSIAAGPDVQ